MGAHCCKPRTADYVEGDSSLWRVVKRPGARVIDPLLTPLEDKDHVELFDLLGEPVAQKALGSYATAIELDHMLMCWAEIEQFKEESLSELRRLQAVEIYDNYVKQGSPLRLGVSEHLEDVLRAELQPDLLSLPSDKGAEHILSPSFFAELQYICFFEIFEKIYQGFINSDEFKSIREEMASKYNMIKVTDFDYFETLGKGSFGIVMRCRKKSTKKFYAIKMIVKAELLHSCRHDLSKLDMEVKALSSLRHPFIIGMDYSFQNSQYAFIVMELAQGGTLTSVLQSFRKHLLKEAHIRFYVAEIAEALHYLHGVGLIYQDLKLSNVLIDMDGHVKLADLGGVADPSGDAVGSMKSESRSEGRSPLTTWIEPSAAPSFKVDYLRNPVRTHNVYGTKGYMAPEVLELLTDTKNCKGLTYMADWWSLGIVTYVLLTGARPFDVPKGASAEEQLAVMRAGQVDFPETASPECVEFICSLLEQDDTRRLGFGPEGLVEIMNHPFFESFKWSKVMKKECRPPIVPSEMDLLYDPNAVEIPLYDGYDSLPMIDKDARIPSPAEQKHFQSWNYISPTTLRIEFGMANAEKQYQQNVKVQKLLGEKKTTETIRLSLSSWASTSTAIRSVGSNDSPELNSRVMFGSGNSNLKSQFSSVNSPSRLQLSSGNMSPTRHNFPKRKSAASVVADIGDSH